MDLVTGTQMIRLFAALVIVVGLMLGLHLVLRRVNGTMGRTLGAKRRLRIVEMIMLDSRRRLVLIRRDDRDHLVILGPTGETVVETGITPPPENTAPENTADDVK